MHGCLKLLESGCSAPASSSNRHYYMFADFTSLKIYFWYLLFRLGQNESVSFSKHCYVSINSFAQSKTYNEAAVKQHHFVAAKGIVLFFLQLLMLNVKNSFSVLWCVCQGRMWGILTVTEPNTYWRELKWISCVLSQMLLKRKHPTNNKTDQIHRCLQYYFYILVYILEVYELMGILLLWVTYCNH